MQALRRFSHFIGKTFAIWAVLFALLGFFVPSAFNGLAAGIKPALAIVMFGMGLTLQAKDFAEVITRPLQVLVGVGAQFLVMPLIALGLTAAFHIDPMIALGVILVGCCPGGTSSNVITFLAKGDVALSVCITTITTLLAPVVTPLLMSLYAGHIIQIDFMSMMWSIMQIVLLPIIAGVVIRSVLKSKVDFLKDILPLVSVAGIVFIVAVVVALSQEKIATTGLLIFVIVIAHNLLGYLLGMLVGKACGFSLSQQKAIMIEVGMQNSGLAAALASSSFAANPVVAVPAAMFSVWHNISGSLLANFLSVKEDK